MDLESENENYYHVDEYAEFITDNTELCTVCQCDETEDGKHWARYKLRCGHISHTRCLRSWCYKKQCVNCPLCGDMEGINNIRCIYCDKWGHSYTKCPIMLEIHELSLGISKPFKGRKKNIK